MCCFLCRINMFGCYLNGNQKIYMWIYYFEIIDYELIYFKLK